MLDSTTDDTGSTLPEFSPGRVAALHTGEVSDTGEDTDADTDEAGDTAVESTPPGMDLPECWDGVQVDDLGNPSTLGVGFVGASETTITVAADASTGSVVVATCGLVESVTCIYGLASVSTDHTYAILGDSVTYDADVIGVVERGVGLYDSCTVTVRGLIDGTEVEALDTLYVRM